MVRRSSRRGKGPFQACVKRHSKGRRGSDALPRAAEFCSATGSVRGFNRPRRSRSRSTSRGRKWFQNCVADKATGSRGQGALVKASKACSRSGGR